MRELGLKVTMQTAFSHAYTDLFIAFLGEELASRMIPVKTFYDNGLFPGGSTDAPQSEWNPLKLIEFNINRVAASGTVIVPEQALPRELSIRHHTIHAAGVTGDEEVLGSIEPGKLADLVVLSEDIVSIPADQIGETQILMTVVGGKTVYSAVMD